MKTTKRIAAYIFALLGLCLFCGCSATAPASTFEPGILTPNPKFEGIEVLALEAYLPELEDKTMQQGDNIQLTDGSLTFDETVWLQNVDQGAYIDPLVTEKTGASITLTVDENSEFWVYSLESAHGDWARISAVDFGQYVAEMNVPYNTFTMFFYSEDGRLLRAVEPNVP